MAGIDTNVKFGCHFDGANNDTAATDFSTAQAAKTITFNGNAKLSTAQAKFGATSLLLDGSGDYLSLADHADWDVTDFTLDFWIYFPTSLDSDAYLFGQMDHSAASGGGIALLTNTVSGQYLQLDIQNSNPPVVSAASGMSANTWYHVAAERSGSTCKIYVNGTSIGSGTNGNATSSTNALLIGIQPGTGGKDASCYIDELRFSNIARYNGDFTPPTEAYSADGGQPTHLRGMFVKGMNRGIGRNVITRCQGLWEKGKEGLFLPNKRIIVPVGMRLA